MCQGWTLSPTQPQKTSSFSRRVCFVCAVAGSPANCTVAFRSPYNDGLYISVQTMYRIKDPKRSLDFYTRIIGMRCVSPCMYTFCVAHALRLGMPHLPQLHSS